MLTPHSSFRFNSIVIAFLILGISINAKVSNHYKSDSDDFQSPKKWDIENVIEKSTERTIFSPDEVTPNTIGETITETHEKVGGSCAEPLYKEGVLSADNHIYCDITPPPTTQKVINIIPSVTQTVIDGDKPTNTVGDLKGEENKPRSNEDVEKVNKEKSSEETKTEKVDSGVIDDFLNMITASEQYIFFKRKVIPKNIWFFTVLKFLISFTTWVIIYIIWVIIQIFQFIFYILAQIMILLTFVLSLFNIDISDIPGSLRKWIKGFLFKIANNI